MPNQHSRSLHEIARPLRGASCCMIGCESPAICRPNTATSENAKGKMLRCEDHIHPAQFPDFCRKLFSSTSHQSFQKRKSSRGPGRLSQTSCWPWRRSHWRLSAFLWLWRSRRHELPWRPRPSPPEPAEIDERCDASRKPPCPDTRRSN